MIKHKPFLRHLFPAVLFTSVFYCGLCVAGAAEESSGEDSPWITGYTAQADPAAPIEVGPREQVGQEGFASKQGKKLLGGLLGKALGSSGNRSGDGPKTRRDPTRKQDYTLTKIAESELECGTRARWKDDGLLVSTRIEASKDKGTFQTVFLQDERGRRLYPSRLEIYKLWTANNLTVFWSRNSTANGQVMRQESGGWSGTWNETDDRSKKASGVESSPTQKHRYPAIWQQAGYGRAQAGVRQLGAYFNLTPEEFASASGLAFYAHVTRPERDPVITQPLAWTISERDGDKLLTTSAAIIPETRSEDHQTRSEWDADAAGSPPCKEAVLRVEEAKTNFLAQIDDPLRLLAAALASARRLGMATTAVGQSQARLAAAQVRLDAAQQYLQAWDAWSEGKIEKREKSREEHYGSREPSWAKGSSERSRKRHNEKSAGLRAEAQALKQNVQAARTALSAAQASLNAVKGDFARNLAAFANALNKLRGAKDLFAEEVTTYYRCSPCETIAKHFASASRLNDLLDRIRGMLGQARASAAATLAQAQVAATAAQQKADAARARFERMENRRTEIEQEIRDAVDTSDGCLSFEPIEGGSYINLASMDGVRGSVVPEGSAMGWRSNFKGSDVRVYTGPGCLRAMIESINWTRINKLNTELADLNAELPEAANEASAAQLTASLARAKAGGLQAEIDAIDELLKVLKDSGIEQNTEDVLHHLDDLSSDCATELKKEIEKIREARERKRKANERIAGAGGARDALRKRAGEAGRAIDGMDDSGSTDEDKSRKAKLRGKADDIEDRARPGGQPVGDGGGTSPAPDTPDEAKKQREEAEDEADKAEEVADTIEDENSGLEDEVDELEDEVDKLDERLRDWRRYHAALARYEDCLRKKAAALEELARINSGAASQLEELAKLVKEAADAVAGAASDTKDISSLNKKARAANKKTASLAEGLADIAKAMNILDTVMNRDFKKPSDKLKAMSDAFELLRKVLPELPGVSEMLEFYNEAMKAIAGKISEIEDALIKYYADAAEAKEDYADLAGTGIRDEVRKLVKIRKLMKIISRNCGKPPVPPAATTVTVN